jgi:hypothetical protein
MKGIFDAYVRWPFGEKFIFELVTHVRTPDYVYGMDILRFIIQGPSVLFPLMQGGFTSGCILWLYNVILRIARNLLETRKNIKIESHPF